MKKIQVEQFEGPLELLLELIESEKLNITDISLSKVTEQYLLYLRELEERNPDELADFLVVASKLLLIKSRILLPELVTEEDDETDLAFQLRMYKEYYDAARRIHTILLKRRFAFSRHKPSIPITPVFNPPRDMTTKTLEELFRKVLKDIEPVIELPREIVRRKISLQQKISSIYEMLKTQAEVRFSSLLKQAESRTEIIVSFLALLELVKQRSIVVRQSRMFDEIVVESNINDNSHDV